MRVCEAMKQSRSVMEKAAKTREYMNECSRTGSMMDLGRLDDLIAVGETSFIIPGIPTRTLGTPEEYEKLLDRIASTHRKSCYYVPDKEVRTCIMPGGSSRKWRKVSYGISWIGVQGTGGICVLSLDDGTSRSSRHSEKQLHVYHVLETAIADIGGASSHSTRRKVARWSKSNGPFAVVSVAPGTVADREASAAINFLEKELKNCSDLTIEKTVQVAVLALEYLFGSRFNLSDIKTICSAELGKVLSNKGQDRFFKDAYMFGARKEGETQEDC